MKKNTYTVGSTNAYLDSELQTGFIDFGVQGKQKKVYSVILMLKSDVSQAFYANRVSYAIDGSSTYTDMSRVISSENDGVFAEFSSPSTTKWIQFEFFPANKIICESISLNIDIPTNQANLSISDIKIKYSISDKDSNEK